MLQFLWLRTTATATNTVTQVLTVRDPFQPHTSTHQRAQLLTALTSTSVMQLWTLKQHGNQAITDVPFRIYVFFPVSRHGAKKQSTTPPHQHSLHSQAQTTRSISLTEAHIPTTDTDFQITVLASPSTEQHGLTPLKLLKTEQSRPPTHLFQSFMHIINLLVVCFLLIQQLTFASLFITRLTSAVQSKTHLTIMYPLIPTAKKSVLCLRQDTIQPVGLNSKMLSPTLSASAHAQTFLRARSMQLKQLLKLQWAASLLKLLTIQPLTQLSTQCQILTPMITQLNHGQELQQQETLLSLITQHSISAQ